MSPSFGYNVWCHEVVHLVTAVGRSRDRLDEETPLEYLVRCRGAEAHEVYSLGETPIGYAAFLVGEELGGPGYLEVAGVSELRQMAEADRIIDIFDGRQP